MRTSTKTVTTSVKKVIDSYFGKKIKTLIPFCSIVNYQLKRVSLKPKKQPDENQEKERKQKVFKEGRIYSESIRVKEKETRRNQIIYTVKMYRTKSCQLINGPQMQKFLLQLHYWYNLFYKLLHLPTHKWSPDAKVYSINYTNNAAIINCKQKCNKYQ